MRPYLPCRRRLSCRDPSSVRRWSAAPPSTDRRAPRPMDDFYRSGARERPQTSAPPNSLQADGFPLPSHHLGPGDYLGVFACGDRWDQASFQNLPTFTSCSARQSGSLYAASAALSCLRLSHYSFGSQHLCSVADPVLGAQALPDFSGAPPDRFASRSSVYGMCQTLAGNPPVQATL